MKLSLEHFYSGPFVQHGQSFIAKGQEWTKTAFRDKSVEIYPGVMQHTPKYAKYLLDLHKELESKLTLHEDENTGECYLSSVDQCLVDWGAGPAGTLPPLEDNTSLRDDKELHDPEPRFIPYIKRLIHEIVQNGEFKSIHFKAVSSCGFPFMQTGVELKAAMFQEIASRFKRFMLLSGYARWEERYAEFGTYPMYTNGVRWQADKVKRDENGQLHTKERYIFDLATGEKKLANLPVVIDGQVVEGLFCSRWRSMYALTRHDNAILQILNNFLHEGAKKTVSAINYEGPQVTARIMKDFINKWSHDPEIQAGITALSYDKSEFGETFCPVTTEIIVEELERKFGTAIANFVRYTLDAPVAYKAQYKDVPGVIFSRDTVEKDPALSLKGSFKSGNSLVGNFGENHSANDAMILSFVACERAGLPWSYEEFKANNSKWYCISGLKGDDTKFIGIEKFMCELRFILKEMKPKERPQLHKDEVDKTPSFLGHKYDFKGNVHLDVARYIEASTGSERGWRAKTYPEFGSLMRDVLYSPNPKHGVAKEAIDRKLYDHFRFDRDKWQRKYEIVGPFNMEYAIFLENPDKFLYLEYLQDKIDPELLKGIYEEVQPEILQTLIESVRNL